MHNEKRIILFGAGVIGRRALDFYGPDKVFCFADNNKAGQEYHGKKIIGIDELIRIHADYTVIISTSYHNAGYLRKQCAEHGIPAAVWGDIVSYDDYESIPSIAKYKDVHKGQRCFIIGNGPSLRATDLDKIHEHGDISFALNSINRIYNQTQWRPRYYFTGTILAFEPLINDILESCVGVNFFQSLEATHTGDVDALKDAFKSVQGEVNYLNRLPLSDKTALPFFSPDPSKAICSGGTTVHTMLQLAAYMGFSAIYLLGTDCTLTTNTDPGVYFSQKRHFYEETLSDIGYAPYLQTTISDQDTNLGLIFNGYQSAKQYADQHGFKIYNATRGGILEVFERVGFDSLF